MELDERYRGCLVGLAVGDALGTTLEFRRPGTFAPIQDMVGGGPFHNGSSFRHGALLAVNLGGDADTTGAVYGQLAGAFYGESGIPEVWRLHLAHRELISSFAGKLLDISLRSRPTP